MGHSLQEDKGLGLGVQGLQDTSMECIFRSMAVREGARIASCRT